MKSLSYTLTLLIVIFSLSTTELMAASYYVDSRRGSDSNPGTLSAPWAKIAKANSTLKAGDTVHIRAGTYAETIRPANSGNSSSYITYQAYNDEKVVIGGNIRNGADLSSRSWIMIKGFEFIDTNYNWLEFEPNGSHNFIVGNSFEATGSSMTWSGIHVRGRADYNKFVDNSFTSACMPRDLVNVYDASYNLFDGNYFGYAAHSAFGLMRKSQKTAYNIIRNNTFQNRLHNNLEIMTKAEHTLVEGNTVVDAGDDCSLDSCYENKCGQDIDPARPREQHSGIKIYSEYGIYRNNVVINNGLSGLFSWTTEKMSVENRIYNNTYYANYIGFDLNYNNDVPLISNKSKNNIISQSKQTNFSAPKFSGEGNQLLNNTFDGSAKVVYKGVSGVSNIENAYPNEFNDSQQFSPGFVNPGSRDLRLRSDSKLIDVGAWLTNVTSASGSGNTFYVADSRYFTNGFGVIPGDKIQIQKKSNTARIKSIDYSSHKIVVDRSISWNKGDGVSLPYTGAAPDIGAFEYGSSSPIENNNGLVPPTLSIANN